MGEVYNDLLDNGDPRCRRLADTPSALGKRPWIIGPTWARGSRNIILANDVNTQSSLLPFFISMRE